MTNQIHGHEVIQMMVDSNQVYTRTSLKTAIISKFGAGTRFHTCSAENMDAEGLIEFLAQRGKLADQAGGFTIAPGKTCNH